MNNPTNSTLHVAAGRHTYGDPASGREQLLDIAIDLFATRGIANTTVAQIAAAGKVTPAMVHYWFETREKLYDAIVDERLVPRIRAVWSSADLQRESALDLVQGMLSRMFSITAEAPWLPSLWLREIVQAGGLLQERVLQRVPQELNSSFRSKISDAQTRGEINPRLEPDLLFISMLALVMLPQAAARGWNKVRSCRTPSREHIEAHVNALVMTGLTAKTPATR